MHVHAHEKQGGDDRRLLGIALGITLSVVGLQVVGGLVAGSLALLADAAHMLTDATALGVALIAQSIARRPADDRRTFGYRRFEVFGAMINAVLAIALSGGIAVAAVGRLFFAAPSEVHGGTMIVFAVIGLAANVLTLWLLARAQRRSINVRGAYLEVLGDAIGSAVVILAAVVVLATGWDRADAAASLLIAAFILPRAWVLMREGLAVLTESAPQGMSVAEIRDHLRAAPGVVDVHDVHVWQLTRGAPVFSAHVVVDKDVLDRGGSAALLTSLQGCLADHFDVAHSTFQLEAVGHEDRDEAHR
ncbi:cation diffusion facilitator family transporter [Microbacterium paludicola]|uniref:Cation transporter n=1 Tax=Microbacterium paludicola TaxID=300019 RepID=A0A4Y9FZZ2_9MICO|nr:cation diffusion facilitator family transporter [Microbacterium paludicola]MBF0815360.1 cation transporter [Microbacterium paludicola]TFU34217.1 cation transporter [Microbacterium paludicola]